jgi:hypothetical protein
MVVVPLGRGPVGFYWDISERDVLDVLDDLSASYPIDADRVFSGGYSMGGYGTLHFAALYPRLFAGASNWVGFTGDGYNTPIPGNPLPPYTHTGRNGFAGSAVGAAENVLDFVGNLRNVPSVNLYSGADELVHVSTSLALEQAFAAADGVVHDFYEHPVAEHLTYAILDDWKKEALYTAPLVRVAKPARVTYRTDRQYDFPEYEIVHDGAYWVSAVTPRGDGYADVDVRSDGCGLPAPTFETGYDAGVDPVPLAWVRQFRRVVATTPSAPSRTLTASFANVASVTIDAGTGGACLAGGPVAYAIHTDGPVTVHLSDGRDLSIAGAGDHSGTLP